MPEEYSTIQAGIDAAAKGDEVVVADGVYTGTGNVNLDFSGKAVTVRSENGPENCIIDCEYVDGTCGFYFHNGEPTESVVDGFTIRNSKASGIFCTQGHTDITKPSIINNIILDNEENGVSCQGGSFPIISHNTIANNKGNGIDCSHASATIEGNIIKGNKNGGISFFYYGDGVISDNSITGNKGSGIHCNWGASPTITNNIITANLAISGGGIYCVNRANPQINGNIITGNSSDQGAGISCTDAHPEIINNAIANNNGFGVYFTVSDQLKIINNTITGNKGGIFCGPGSSAAIVNTTLWENIPHEIESLSPFDLFTPTLSELSISYSDIQGGQARVAHKETMVLKWGDGNINAEPLFVDSANGDYHLSNLSPCISMGIMTDDVSSLDIEGNPRPDPPGSSPDIGAYESSWGTLPARVKSEGKQAKPWGGIKDD